MIDLVNSELGQLIGPHWNCYWKKEYIFKSLSISLDNDAKLPFSNTHFLMNMFCQGPWQRHYTLKRDKVCTHYFDYAFVTVEMVARAKWYNAWPAGKTSNKSLSWTTNFFINSVDPDFADNKTFLAFSDAENVSRSWATYVLASLCCSRNISVLQHVWQGLVDWFEEDWEFRLHICQRKPLLQF